MIRSTVSRCPLWVGYVAGILTLFAVSVRVAAAPVAGLPSSVNESRATLTGR